MKKILVSALNIDKIFISKLVIFAGLTTIAVFAPIAKEQMITGPLINATLFVGAALIGVEGAVLVGLAPSLIALSTGLLPLILAPMIPFVMTANIILILIFNQVKKKNYWLAVVTASFTKFIFLFSASSIFINLISKKEITSKITAMMSWPQLLTALLGGALAHLLLKIIKKT